MEFFENQITCSYSPKSIDIDDIFSTENTDIDVDVKPFNPDDFLNLEAFHDVKQNELFPEKNSITNNYSNNLQQLTPPISPQPNSQIFIDNSALQSINFIPVTKVKQQIHSIRKIKSIVPKPSSTSSNNSDSDTNNIKKIIITSCSSVDRDFIKRQRLIRNRMSAINSRKKKNEYVQTLEAENLELHKENKILKIENLQLKERLRCFNRLTCRCASSFSSKLSSKNAVALCAITLLIGLNILSFRNFSEEWNFKKHIKVGEVFQSRNLLHGKASTEYYKNKAASNDSLYTDDPVIYFNQTERIRKVNIENIRRWIPEPDLNISNLAKGFEFNPDPSHDKLAKMYEKSHEQNRKVSRNKKRIPKKKPMIGPVQFYNSNLNIIKLYEFFDEIDRKDDTFYVFSFRAEHLLLPAIDSSYNFSQIKMNLIMPQYNNDILTKNKITMMQIETIILNTSLIQISEKSIPVNFLRKKNNYNSTMCNESNVNFNSQEKIVRRDINEKATNGENFQKFRKKAAEFPNIKMLTKFRINFIAYSFNRRYSQIYSQATRKEDGSPIEEFRVLTLYKTKTHTLQSRGRKPKVQAVPPPRTQQMAIDQDWSSVWPGPKTFHPASVPLPIRQGWVKINRAPPGKFANAELMKIPNFLHLTPPVISKHCEAIKKFCTPWPKELTGEKAEKKFPLRAITSDYVHGMPTIRNHLSRIVTIKIKLSNLNLDEHAKDKFLRFVGERYNPDNDEITIVADRCPTKKQNHDYAIYLLTALYHESNTFEEWEKAKIEADMETYYWKDNKSKISATEIINWRSQSEDKIEPLQEYGTSVEKLFNEGENNYNLDKYKYEVLKMIGIVNKNS
ncbi:CLUMA_CG006311, isoform A [Clunio marinus]|uniref:CLUMA_CG006311, isoform A n=1 Tax=Clunio marinus TaxID=568069 RepID=A0A1J1I1E9_9DIPT|nr:CLUMA_CG006311, isoform A [Clunio marinus]